MSAFFALGRGVIARHPSPTARGAQKRPAPGVRTRATPERQNNVVSPSPGGIFGEFGLASPFVTSPSSSARDTSHGGGSEETSARTSSRNFDCLIFDLDGVLYPADNGYAAHVRENATRFIAEKFSVGLDEAERVRAEASALADQTVTGLRQLGYEVDPDAFSEYCRTGEDLFLKPNDEVITAVYALSARYGGAALRNPEDRNAKEEASVVSLPRPATTGTSVPEVGPERPQDMPSAGSNDRATTAILPTRTNPSKPEKGRRKMVLLTNASERRATIALECLGLNAIFTEVYGADFLGSKPKPKPEAFKSTLARLGIDDPSRCVMFEDSIANARAAKEIGMRVVFVAGETRDAETADRIAEDEIGKIADAVVSSINLKELVKAMPTLWK